MPGLVVAKAQVGRQADAISNGYVPYLHVQNGLIVCCEASPLGKLPAWSGFGILIGKIPTDAPPFHGRLCAVYRVAVGWSC
jgi:hypothetical protein